MLTAIILGLMLSMPVRDVFPDATYFFYANFFIKDYQEFIQLMLPVKPTVEEKVFSGSEIWRDNKVIGWCFYVNEIGKELPITFQIFVSSKPEVMYLRVEKYRETRGGEIRSKLFRKQFRGKTPSSRLLVGEDIKNIRGATLSAWATTRAVRKAFALVSLIKKDMIRIEKLEQKSLNNQDTEAEIKRSFKIGDSYLSIKMSYTGDRSYLLKDIHKFTNNLSESFENLYLRGEISPPIKNLITRAERRGKESGGYFDIYWRKEEKPDVGGIWKGYVVDKLSEYLNALGVKDFEINFGESSFYFSPPAKIRILGKDFEFENPVAVSVSDTHGNYFKIHDPLKNLTVSKKIKVAVIHESAEFADFASTLCAIQGKGSTDFIINNKGIVIWNE